MERFLKLFTLICFLTLAIGPTVQAADNEVLMLKEQIDTLNRKLEALESKMMTMEQPAPGAQTVYIPSVDTERPGLLRAVENIDIGGYIDTQYQNTFESSKGQNVGRVFSDRAKDTFSMNAAKLWLEKVADPEGGAGFRIDLLLGSDARFIDFNDGGTTAADEFAIEQAYAQFIVPLSFWAGSEILPDSIDFKMGRFVTMAGYEVIDGPDNWNISRSIGFGYGLPFAHTGLRATFGLFNDFFTVTTGINNGWDQDIGSHSYKTFEGAVSFEPFKDVSWTTAAYVGKEAVGNATPNVGTRFLVTNIVNWDVNDKLALGGDFDFGNQRRVDIASDGTFENAEWYEVAGYARYQITDKLAAAYRIEYFRDKDRYRNWTNASPDGAMSDFANTLTFEYKLSDNLIGRGEYRIDYAHAGDGRVFNGESHQNTLGGQLIYQFG